MNWKRFAITAVVATVIVLIFNWVFHNILLEGLYARTAEAWRGPDEMNVLAITAGQILSAVAFTWLYFAFVKQSSAKTGALFGIGMAVIFAGSYLVNFAVQPIVVALAVYWIIGGLIKYALVGSIVGAMYKD